MTEAEKHGIPTVSVVAEGFQRDFELSARVFGLGYINRVIVHTALTNLSAEEIRREIGGKIDGIVAGLTEGTKTAEIKQPTGSPLMRIAGADYLEAYDEMNRTFIKNGWSDGLPLVAATPGKVREMLNGTERSPDEIICNMEPGRRPATITKIAINAVMAGCLPEHLPVIIATVEAMSAADFELRGMAMSTGPHAPMLVINGPIVKKLGINSGMGALGPGAPSFANIVIGRAVRLVMMNVGQAYLGQMDMDTIGSPNKYSMCIGENEDKNPWEPFHVARGFQRDENTVTVFGVESQLEVCNQVSVTPEDLMRTFTGTACSAGYGGTAAYVRKSAPVSNNMLLIAPDHAAVFARNGWDRRRIMEYMFQNSRIQWRNLKNASMNSINMTRDEFMWLWEAPEDTWLQVAERPGQFHIVVVGGPAGKSSYLTGHGIMTGIIRS